MTTITVTEVWLWKNKTSPKLFFNRIWGHFDLILLQKVGRCVREIYSIPMKWSEWREAAAVPGISSIMSTFTEAKYSSCNMLLLSVSHTDVNSSIHPNQEMYKKIFKKIADGHCSSISFLTKKQPKQRWTTCIKTWTHYCIQKVHTWALKTVLDTRQSKFSQAYFLIYIQLHILSEPTFLTQILSNFTKMASLSAPGRRDAGHLKMKAQIQGVCLKMLLQLFLIYNLNFGS